METISTQELKARLVREKPKNNDRKKGFALVNVLKPDSYGQEHIPESINIPKGQESEFERRFDKQKEIIVYCASPSCNASSLVAEELSKKGFLDVVTYEGGLSEWKEAGNRLESRAQAEVGASL